MEYDRGPAQITTTTTTTDYTDGETRREEFKKYSDTTSQIVKRSHSYEPPAKIKPG